VRLNNIVIATGEYESMLDFYKKLTDWPVFFESEKCCFLGRGKPYIVLHRPGPDTTMRPPEKSLCLDFEVYDVDDEVERLERYGIQVEKGNNIATVHDPAGNLIELVLSE
jgi:catechol 2,3-dioxygenase-like lactoylglutathione lyase family enzyme